ncbi:hypothetical protein ATI61_103679 [Archangium gephyra]|uniref:Treponemal membrane protein B-like protein n=1 Tax=Archangium gephyra TaxID=48 RepID=A0AAC8Q6H4_9BACT|nr:DUF4398 domain-containing protein [Archangium gephyra]AKJ01960.1 putative treponemal membrane protein B precursor-like protein [Archangium gephyra]REG34768.1 hypothetical protein ATI61_103679 [Archangium gephyra]
MKRLLVLVAAAGAVAGCGPLRSTSNLLDAEVQIQAARTAGAEKLAPYEWTAANLYIRKAREEVGYSDFQAGVDFAEKAARFAAEARTKAMANANGEEATSPSPNP